jgi:hypothetical protein
MNIINMWSDRSNAISFSILDEALFNNKVKWFRMLREACQNQQMMHLNIWRFNISTSKLSFTTKKFHQIEVLLCGFHNKACCSITWRYTSLEVVGKSLLLMHTFHIWKTMISRRDYVHIKENFINSTNTFNDTNFVLNHCTAPNSKKTHLNIKP